VSKWHLVTSEYPPQLGGVSDYTRLVANGLAEAGDEVHVWSPRAEQRSEVTGQDIAKCEIRSSNCETTSVTVHRDLGRMAPADLRRVGKMLDEFPAPRRLLLQWVPHGFGMRAMNLPFCLWLWNRSRKGDVVEIMAHECFLPIKRWAWKQNIAALVQRVMTIILLRSTRSVWISIPAWEARWRPLAFGRRVTFTWLPVPSNIAVINDPIEVSAVRARYGINGEPVLGHFGTYGRHARKMLAATLPLILRNGEGTKIILMGRNSDRMCDQLVKRHPDLSNTIHASGTLNARELSLHLSACELLLQPCEDGVSTRRGSVMAGLSHGRPIVTTTGRLTESVWRDSQAVVLVPDGDVRVMADETQRVLNDKYERQRLSIGARMLYEEEFDVKHVIAALREDA
jgi:glycosyltransferase involved in cell wall biosynthesis